MSWLMMRDLDSAAIGIVQAAFGFQGQKCSACSRLIVDEKVHDELMEKIVTLDEKSENRTADRRRYECCRGYQQKIV